MNLRTSERVASSVRAECARQRISQRDIAKKLGVSHTAVNRRMAGTVPFDVDELAAIADLLDLSICDLFPADKASA